LLVEPTGEEDPPGLVSGVLPRSAMTPFRRWERIHAWLHYLWCRIEIKGKPARSLTRSLQFDVYPQREDRDGTAIAVVGGMIDLVEVSRHVDALADLTAVVDFQDLFQAVVQTAVADDEPQPARGQVVAMGR